MSPAWRARIERFEAMSLRERRLAVLAAGFLVAALVYAVAVAPAESRSAKLQKELAAAESERAAQITQLETLRLSLAVHPDAQRLAELDSLQQQSLALDAELQALGGLTVAPQRMRAMVQTLLSERRGWEVVEVRSLPPQRMSMPLASEQRSPPPIGASAPPASAAPEDPTAPALYRHAMEIEIIADYGAAIDYLRRIENLPARVVTASLDLQTLAWPRLRIRLRLQSLSLQEGWLGV